MSLNILTNHYPLPHGAFTPVSNGNYIIDLYGYKLNLGRCFEYGRNNFAMLFADTNVFINTRLSAYNLCVLMNKYYSEQVGVEAAPFYSEANTIRRIDTVFSHAIAKLPPIPPKIKSYSGLDNLSSFPYAYVVRAVLSPVEGDSGTLNWQPLYDFLETCGYENFRFIDVNYNAVTLEIDARSPHTPRIMSIVEIGSYDFIGISLSTSIEVYLYDILCSGVVVPPKVNPTASESLIRSFEKEQNREHG